MPRHRGLRLPEDDLEIGDEQGTRGEAIQNAKPGRLGERDKQFGWCGKDAGHMRVNEYMDGPVALGVQAHSRTGSLAKPHGHSCVAFLPCESNSFKAASTSVS